MHIEPIRRQPPFVTPTGMLSTRVVEAGVYGDRPARVIVEEFKNSIGQTFHRRTVGGHTVEWAMIVGDGITWPWNAPRPERCGLRDRCQFARLP